MRNLKKVIAVVVTLVMLLGIAAISASAAANPTVTLLGKSETGITDGTEGYYEVVVHVDDANTMAAGGAIEGIVTYDSTLFTYAGVEVNDSIKALNPDTAVALDKGNGTIAFICVGNGSVEDWFILKFKVNEAGTADFTLKLKAADDESYLTVTAVNETTTVKNDGYINIKGAQLKLIENAQTQDIRFVVDLDESKVTGTVSEIGVLLMYTKRLGHRELTVDIQDATGLAVARKVIGGDVEVPTGEFFANVNGMAVDQLGVKISARAYVKVDDVVYYSNNYILETKINSGYASKSVVDVARAAAADAKANCKDAFKLAAIETILDKTSITGDDRISLIAFVNEYYLASEL